MALSTDPRGTGGLMARGVRTGTMTTFLSGGTGTPKLLSGADAVFDPGELTVIGNTGDDVELGGLFVSPDVDTVLFERGGVLDTGTWWGIDDDSHETHDRLHELAAAADLATGPRYLPDDRQTDGRELAAWRRFSGIAEFMTIGDRDRAVHLTRTSLLDEGRSLTEATDVLARAFGITLTLVPMSDDPVATLIHTESGKMHFQEWWVAHRGEPPVEEVEFRGAERAEPTPEVRSALADPVVIGPSNPVTSIGPMLALPGVERALSDTPVIAVSPFVGDRVFSGPAADLMEATGHEPSTRGVADAYPFADGFVLDEADDTEPERPVARTDTDIESPEDAARVARAVETLLSEVA